MRNSDPESTLDPPACSLGASPFNPTSTEGSILCSIEITLDVLMIDIFTSSSHPFCPHMAIRCPHPTDTACMSCKLLPTRDNSRFQDVKSRASTSQAANLNHLVASDLNSQASFFIWSFLIETASLKHPHSIQPLLWHFLITITFLILKCHVFGRSRSCQVPNNAVGR
jgi:hypothetical protein